MKYKNTLMFLLFEENIDLIVKEYVKKKLCQYVLLDSISCVALWM